MASASTNRPEQVQIAGADDASRRKNHERGRPMGLRYTAVAGMEQTSPRNVELDIDHWRDRIELRLDNRQVFFLFFGSAIVASMLFVLGVMVGKRIESRGQAQAPELSDPLAALDRAHMPPPSVPPPAPQQQQLAFPNTLIAGASVPKPIVAAKPVVAKPAPPKPVAAKPAALLALAPLTAPKPLTLASNKPAAMLAAPKPLAPAVTPPVAPAPAATLDPTKVKGKFTLHLSTFATAEEANLFVKRYPGAFVVAGDIAGKGMSYRVRYGNFASFKEASAAKESFEKQHNMIALVAAR
jgi:DedD protein